MLCRESFLKPDDNNLQVHEIQEINSSSQLISVHRSVQLQFMILEVNVYLRISNRC